MICVTVGETGVVIRLCGVFVVGPGWLVVVLVCSFVVVRMCCPSVLCCPSICLSVCLSVCLLSVVCSLLGCRLAESERHGI